MGSMQLSTQQTVEWLARLSAAGVREPQQEFNDLAAWAKNSDELQQALSRRVQREPFAYIVGTQPFYHRLFITTPDVLIPRPETEQFVDHIIALLPTNQPLTIVDCGTGSGAIAITLASERPHLTVIGIDQSEAALIIARNNAKAFNTSIDFRHGDLLRPIMNEHIDGIIANLPYLPEAWRNTLEPELYYEPSQALFAGEDGLDVIRRFIQQVKLLHNRPQLWLEILPQQTDAVSTLLQTTLRGTTQVLFDLSHTPRFMYWTSL